MKLLKKETFYNFYIYFMLFSIFMGGAFLKFNFLGINFNLSRILMIVNSLFTLIIMIKSIIVKEKILNLNSKYTKFCVLFFIIWSIYSILSFYKSYDIKMYFVTNFFICVGTLNILFFLKFVNIKELKDKIFTVITIPVFINCLYYLFLFFINKQNIGGFYHNSNDLGTVLLLTIPMSLYLIFDQKSKYLKTFYSLVFLTFLISFINIGSRGAILGLIVFALFIGVYEIIKHKQKIFKSKYLKTIIILSIIAFLILTGNFIYNKIGLINLTPVENAVISNDIRVNLIYNGLFFLSSKLNWLTGIGAGNAIYYLQNFSKYTTAGIYNFHNLWLDVLVEHGSIIFIGFIIVYIICCKELFKKYRNKRFGIASIFLLFFISFSVACISSSSLLTREWLWICIGIILSYINTKTEIQPAKKSNSKNILMIATSFPPMGGIGSVRITKYVKYLKKHGWNPTVITVDEKFITNKDESLLKDLSDDIKIYKLNFKQKHKDISIDFYNALKKQIGNIINKKQYDMVFITGGPFMILPIGNYIYQKYGIDYIIDLRDPWKLQKLNYNNKIKFILSLIKREIKGVLERKTFKYAKKICTVNDTMTNEYINEYPEYKDKFITIPNGFDLSDYENIEPIKLDNFTIVYTGKFETSAGFRNPRLLFKVLKKINDNGYNVNFLHVGKEETKVINIMKEEKCEKYCSFVGLKKFSESISYCKGSDILIAISGKSKNEQTGKIFDYICINKPIVVLSNNGTEINKVCEDFSDIYIVNSDDEKKLYDTITKLYDNKKNIKRNLKNSKYNRENLTKKLIDILGE